MDLSQADRAALRPGTNPWEVQGFYDLLRCCPDYNRSSLALAAPLVAEVRTGAGKSLGKACRRNLSARRSRRLLAARDWEDLVHQLRSVVRFLDRTKPAAEPIRLVVFRGGIAGSRLATRPSRSHPSSVAEIGWRSC